MSTAAQIRRFFRGRDGRASLQELYAALATRAGGLTMRQVSASAERLIARGELEPDGGHYLFRPKPETRGMKGQAHARLWRAAHLKNLNGQFTGMELAVLADVRGDSVCRWIAAMKARGYLVMVGNRDRSPLFRVAAKAPGPQKPPRFTWPRRGSAKKHGER